uniref:Uncharacterized protein n=1 Tax=Pseudomonas phage HRDY3 TaxID=3236930 RepID=A0AB39CDS6_9VIRU
MESEADVGSFEVMRKEFLSHYIFCPEVVELSAAFEAVLLSLNVWPKGSMVQQRKGLLKREQFQLGKTLIKTGFAQTTIISRDGTRHTMEQ